MFSELGRLRYELWSDALDISHRADESVTPFHTHKTIDDCNGYIKAREWQELRNEQF